jgi:hypothetical protein
VIPPRSFPSQTLRLLEFVGRNPVKIHAELPSSLANRMRLENMKLDMLLSNPKVDLTILEYAVKLELS